MSCVEELEDFEDFVEFRAAGAPLALKSAATDVQIGDVIDQSFQARYYLIPPPYTGASQVNDDAARRWVPGNLKGHSAKLVSAVTNAVNMVGVGWQDAGFIVGMGAIAGLGDFALLDELRSPEGQIRRQVEILRTSRALSYHERLARRLEFLLDAMKDEGDDWNEGSAESLRLMLLFLESEPDFVYPTVSVTPGATFRVQWSVDASEHFAVDFLPNGQVRYVVFCPDPRRPGDVQRISGITSRQNLMHVVEPFKVRRWAADGSN
ncbi:MAG: hypothetical protein MI725_04270 [Pirellulales bacterium]|nr:hypothetical protein [Pirellulales bacterium]